MAAGFLEAPWSAGCAADTDRGGWGSSRGDRRAGPIRFWRSGGHRWPCDRRDDCWRGSGMGTGVVVGPTAQPEALPSPGGRRERRDHGVLRVGHRAAGCADGYHAVCRHRRLPHLLPRRRLPHLLPRPQSPCLLRFVVRRDDPRTDRLDGRRRGGFGVGDGVRQGADRAGRRGRDPACSSATGWSPPALSTLWWAR